MAAKNTSLEGQKVIDLDVAYAWLHYSEESRLSSCSKSLVEELHTAVKDKAYDQARRLIDSLKSLGCEVTDERELAEVLLECGWAAYKMGDLVEASLLLNKAAIRFALRSHEQAVALWMLGRVCWQMPPRHSEA
ncbi:MAG: hypothetical protein EHM70_25095, partial [Chloroflexota bacterium]